MAEYRITSDGKGLDIEVTGVAGRQAELAEAFQECRDGQCTCPTNEYEKLDSMRVGATDDQINLRLNAKAGTEFDASKISACLDYTIAQVTRPED